MAPIENSQSAMNKMTKNYKKQEEITIDIKNHTLDEYLEFGTPGHYQFFKCEDCDGPILGHQQAKCRNGDRYDERTLTSFEGF